ncbi:MBOAT family O-acyltransferase [Rhodoferax sp. WC2427]|uniref:MBOAT family O-acyltransferase n=1 Tax=Rhodoferax sp. WC2427 TaxID=3234144 RepID=UPI003467BF63
MAFTSLTFIAFVAAVVLLFNATNQPVVRSTVLLGANGVFIWYYIDSAIQLLPLAAFLLVCYGMIEVVRRSRSAPSLWCGLAVAVTAFIYLKKFGFLDASWLLPFPYLIIGLSYVLFRVLHLMVDAKQGELARPISLLNFLNYTCNFLTFVAGPIQRYQDYMRFKDQALVLDEARVFQAFARVILGFVKVGVVSAIFKYLFDSLSERVLDTAAAPAWPMFCALFVGAAVCYTVYLYSNFAGYMDIVIGVGELMGMQLPENFNRPFLARSFLDFWSRWHMTLSDWFKTYVFNPLLTVLATRFTSPKAGPYLGVVAFFVTFLIMGVWHGTTSVFVVYGLLMGAGASINKLWQVMIVKRLGKKAYKALAEKALSIYFSRGLTLAYFALALTCLWVDMPQLLALLQRLGVVGCLVSYLVLAVLAGGMFYVWDMLMGRIAPLRMRWTQASSGVLARNVVLALQILLIATVASFFHKAPEFVYRAF